ncbi:MAG: hypothetical protein C0596_12275 [Marinilabiliales bacterium]|nr:MAG: hypothetical protein C0596_12275 [Marinilabiliales bacterium]
MKKINFLFLFAAILAFVSCNTVSNIANSDTAANASGVSCGKLLTEMHDDYKASGKVNLTDTNTILNIIELGGYYKTLKAHENDAAYKKAFAAGLVTGSDNQITEENSMAVVEALLDMEKITEITEQTSSTASSAVTVANQLVAIFKLFK